MKAARTVLGVALLAGSLYLLAGEHLAGTSADATINARLYVVRAPIEGRTSLAVRDIGARVKPGELLADIGKDIVCINTTKPLLRQWIAHILSPTGFL